MAAKFETYVDKAGEHRFRLKAGNGEIILVSEGYSAKAGCANGIESVRKNAADAANFEKTETAAREVFTAVFMHDIVHLCGVFR